ncbi:hypothetical protein D3C86_1788250 [compost metagenome]
MVFFIFSLLYRLSFKLLLAALLVNDAGLPVNREASLAALQAMASIQGLASLAGALTP